MSVSPTRCFSVSAGLTWGNSSCGADLLSSTENCVFSHMILRTPPPAGSLSIASVSWSTALSRLPFFRSTWTRSCAVSTGSPHCPTSVLIASFEVPVSEGIM